MKKIPPIPVFVPGEKFKTPADVEAAIENELKKEAENEHA